VRSYIDEPVLRRGRHRFVFARAPRAGNKLTARDLDELQGKPAPHRDYGEAAADIGSRRKRKWKRVGPNAYAPVRQRDAADKSAAARVRAGGERAGPGRLTVDGDSDA
jgi:hypothetical protein